MNKQRRHDIEAVGIKIEETLDRINEILADEQEAYENIPESLQESERGERMAEGIEQIEEAASQLEYALECLNAAIE